MHSNGICQDRRAFLRMMAASALISVAPAARAQAPNAITVWKDPNCGCCGGWIEHLQRNGFVATVIETDDVQTIKARQQVPAELVSCHTAVIAGYTIEGHVPASAIMQLLSERPAGRGLAVPGMPIGSPGMEGGRPEEYNVLLFGDGAPKPFARFLGDKRV